MILGGYQSSGVYNYYRKREFDQLPPKVVLILLQMHSNLNFIYLNCHKIQDDNDKWFFRKMHASNISVGSKAIYPLFTFNNKNNFYRLLDIKPELCQNVALYIHTGMLLYFGNYDETLIKNSESKDFC